MKYLGYRDEEIPESCTVSEAAEKYLEVHANTIRKWIKQGRLEAVRVHGELRIMRPSMLAFLDAWRRNMPSAVAVLTVDELNHAAEAIAKVVKVGLDEVNDALEELEERHHLSFAGNDPPEKRKIIVHHGLDPEAPIARMIKRMLAPKLHNKGNCPWCDSKLPHVLRASNSPRPQSVWTLGMEPVSTDHASFIIGYWHNRCSYCEKTAHLFDITEMERAGEIDGEHT